MIRILAILAATSFFGLAIFGFLGMADHGFNTCLVRAVHGGICPGNTLNFLNFHLDALKVFSLATLLLGLALAILGILTFGVNASILTSYFQKPRAVFNYSFKQIYHWLILHETSPTF